MDPSSAPTSAPPPPSCASFDALAPLTFLGWRLGLAAIVAGLTASFFLYGYALVYWRNADMDLMVIYNALVLNDGKPQHFFDHTGYLTILSVKVWFEMLHGLGLLNSYSLSTMPPASDPQAFDAAMTNAVRAGRLIAWLVSNRLRAGFRKPCPRRRARLAPCLDRDFCIRLFRRARRACPYFAHRVRGGVPRHFRLDDPDRDRAPRKHGTLALDGACRRAVRAGPG